MSRRFLHATSTRSARALIAASSAMALLVAPNPGHAQDAQPRIAVQGVALSADTVLLGDRFSLTVTLRLTEGSVAFLPDSILGRGFEPFGAVEWTASAIGGGVELAATYPLIAFEVGDVEIPDFEVYAADAAEGVRAGMAEEGQPVGGFDTFVENVRLIPSARLTSVPPTRIAVVSVLHAEDMEYGIAPRPVADVAGGDRNWPATLMTVFFGIALLGVTGVSAREWAAARVRPSAPPPSAKEVALSELDALLAEDLAAAHTRDFYIRTSGIARRFVESFEARWGPSWTGTELMDGLAAYAAGPASRGDAPPPLPSTAPVRNEVAAAERVKFGGVRPDADEAEGHANRLRQWIEAVPDDPGAEA